MFGDPVYGEEFFDREEILSLLKRRVEDLKEGRKRNVALVGLRKTGKTSILLQLKNSLKDPDVLPIFVYVSPVSVDAFASTFIGALLYSLLKRHEDRPEENVGWLMEHASGYAPKTVIKAMNIQRRLAEGDVEEGFRSLFDLPSSLRDEIGLLPLVILDEFQRFEDFEVRFPFDIIRERIMDQRDVLYLRLAGEDDGEGARF